MIHEFVLKKNWINLELRVFTNMMLDQKTSLKNGKDTASYFANCDSQVPFFICMCDEIKVYIYPKLYLI